MIAKYVLFHTGTLQYTYPKSHDMLTKLGSDSPLVQLIGYDNILISNGHLWKNQRKLVNPAFHRSMPIKTVSSVIFDLFSAIEKENGTISIAPKMKDFTLDALGLTLFGFDFKALKGDPDEWTKVFRQGIQVAMDPFLNVLSPLYSVLSFIFPEKRRQMKAVIKLNGKMDQMIKQKHTEVLSGAYSDIPENEKDLVVLMLEAERRGEGITNDLQLRNNMALLLLAGHDTTATALSFCFYNIAKNKHVQQKLREEIIGVLGDEPVDIVPTLEQLKEMPYLNLVIQENLRLNEPLNYLIPRVAKKDMIVDDILIPKGTTINFDIYGIHHNPKYWRNPNQFIPERFAKGGEHETHEGLTWLPFGDGSRRCIGMNFSMFQQRLVLAMIIRKYEIDISKDANDHRHIAGFKTKSRGSPKLTFTKRY
ncbi:hypothetical protein G6F46_010258 [Rhizopus delemar]|uniref:Cytochrome P450 n=2 Tax=Rhizopus TaxID=4842 RepID=A0A9P6YVM9_9FUNG|nr:hypothetical protein G6F55_006474 [Rhizopus delemar]KAG1536588.1 hypothetical protein G6F51_010884 [Rhizopus arrhizus]KAG1495578.1 hypothetical protein G6F54_007072 [Rhizopus delemar]KAG1503657.1 hypothetical protein G6F53_010578 [Rhizopus delemar]KAG1543794.1 hypothetical protein G6F49_011250 [Rhizopus delemar]